MIHVLHFSNRAKDQTSDNKNDQQSTCNYLSVSLLRTKHFLHVKSPRLFQTPRGLKVFNKFAVSFDLKKMKIS